MKKIQLTQGKVALVDDEDYPVLSQYKWCAHNQRGRWYAARGFQLAGKHKVVTMHRAILGLTDPADKVDHRDRDGLNNRRSNLRSATHAENNLNRGPVGLSRFKGVSWFAQTGKWSASIKLQDKKHHLGYYAKEEHAALVYNGAAMVLFGDYAYLNGVP